MTAADKKNAVAAVKNNSRPPSPNPWMALRGLVLSGRRPVVVSLAAAPAPYEDFVGLISFTEDGLKFEGPLAEAPFWPEQAAALADRVQAALSETEPCLVESQGGFRYFLDRPRPPRRALIMGAGHVGRALARALLFLEYEVTVFDDRPEFLEGLDPAVQTIHGSFKNFDPPRRDYEAAAVVSRGHAQDSQSLRRILSWPAPPSYLGMIGSRKRSRDTLAMLAAEGFSPELLGRIHTPIGLDIGARTPQEIAVAIAAQIIAARTGRRAGPGSNAEGP